MARSLIRNSLMMCLPACALMLAQGCSTINLGDMAAYRELPMADAQIMPTPEQVQARRTKVVVLDIDDQAVRHRLPDGGLLALRKLEEILSEGGSEVVDRSLAARLRQEITLAETRGDGQNLYSGPELAHFAVRGFLSDVGGSSRYTAPSEVCDKKGKCTQIKASCAYLGSASGGLRVYELPSLRLVSSFNLKGSAYSSDGSYCRSDTGALGGVVRAAVDDAISDNKVELKNLFAPKGYLSEKRGLDRRLVFKMMLGRSHQINPGDRVTVFNLRKKENRLTRQMEYEEVPVTTGLVADNVAEEHAWIVPDDLSKAEQIRLGDYARVQHRKGFFD